MRVPQVNERVKEAPAHALRAMFAGIGQLLSVTDKLRGKPTEAPATAETAAKAPETTAANGTATAPEVAVMTETVTVETPVSETTAPETTAPETTAEAEAATVKRKTPTPDATPAGGNVKLIPPEKTAPQTKAAVAEAVPAEPAVAEPAVAEVTPAAELPLANYDSLTVASLRARLRNLSVAQLGQLIAYEKAHAARADVIAMFERRVAKLESES
jgi:hypothetical protein